MSTEKFWIFVPAVGMYCNEGSELINSGCIESIDDCLVELEQFRYSGIPLQIVHRCNGGFWKTFDQWELLDHQCLSQPTFRPSEHSPLEKDF